MFAKMTPTERANRERRQRKMESREFTSHVNLAQGISVYVRDIEMSFWAMVRFILKFFLASFVALIILTIAFGLLALLVVVIGSMLLWIIDFLWSPL